MKKVKGFIKLIRFELPVSAGICVIMGQLFALGNFPSLFIILSGFMSIFLISASILVLNDYFDVETDKINSPHRPIPSNLVTLNEALLFSLILLSAGMLLSYLIGIIPFLISIAVLFIGFLYNRYFKKSGLFGNLLVSFSVGMTFIYGGATVGFPFNKVVMFFAVITALIDLGEEIAADAMDIEGDLLINSKSVAIKYGKSIALKLSAIIFIIVIILSSISFLLKWFTIIYLIPIGIMDISIAYFLRQLLISDNIKGRKAIRGIYMYATFGLIIFLIMKLAGIEN